MRTLIALGLLVLLVALAGCESSDDGGEPAISATTGIWTEVTERIAGDDATVEQVIPDGTSPHEFQLSAQDRAEIEDSLLLVYNGAELEAGIPIDEIDVEKFAVADHVGPLERFRPAGDQIHPTSEEDEEGGFDPHVWMDPTRTAEAVPALAEALAEADPDHADAYRARARSYQQQLATLDEEMRSSLNSVPAENRKLVTSHDALGYFADHFGFELIATPFPASGPEAEPSAQTIAEVEGAIRESNVPTVFAQATDNPEVLEGIAARTGVRIVEDLHVEAPGDAETYARMLGDDAEIIAAGLRGP